MSYIQNLTFLINRWTPRRAVNERKCSRLGVACLWVCTTIYPFFIYVLNLILCPKNLTWLRPLGQVHLWYEMCTNSGSYWYILSLCFFHKACRWKGIVYYDGDRWTENDVAFYCSSSEKKVRPGCYVERNRVKCTGAIPGMNTYNLFSFEVNKYHFLN